ncbi:MAG: ABC transporter permease [Sporolactobacillus sp.]
MISAWKVIREQFGSLYLIHRLSLYELKSETSNNYLGMAWIVLNPLIQIMIYWLIFGQIIGKGGVTVENGETIPYIDWLIAGIYIWFFLQPSIIQGSKSIYSRIRFIAKMNFPMSTIPTYVIFEKFYQHLLLTVIIVVILQFTPYKLTFYVLQLPYFMFASLAFLIAVSLITSTLSTIVRDLHQILISVMRMLFYLTPFLWEPSKLGNLPAFVHHLLLLNPMYYLVQGYRATLLGICWYPAEHLFYTLYFWLFVLTAFLLGSAIHLKFRDHFVDYL